MYFPVVKRFIIVSLIVAATLFARAQQTHFLYLQTENGQPFYVKINNKIVSSSAAGYLIISKLTDGNYQLNVGFPKKEFPEENFQIIIDKKNEGFLLKNFGEKGWGLFDLQSYAVVMGGNTDVIASPSNLQDDPFSKLLANVVKDSTILQKNEPLQEKPLAAKTDSATAKFDSLIAKANSTNAMVDSTIARMGEATPPLPSPPTRFLSKKNKDGMEMIYIDHNQDVNDTIRIFIPSLKPIVKVRNIDTPVIKNALPPVTAPADTNSVAAEQPVPQSKADANPEVPLAKKDTVENKDIVAAENKDSVTAKKTDEEKQPEIKLQDSVVTPGNVTEAVKKDEMVVLPKVVQSSSTNSDCKSFASNEDFLKLRKKMASENSDDNMIKIAKKTFHIKCFSTEQIKNLSFLFLTNAGKYMFFDMAYPFASDSEQYTILESQLTDSYYISRFKAMIHK